MPQVLDVYLHGDRAGRLARSRGGALSFAYDAGHLKRDGPPLSAALPPRPAVFRGRPVRAYFFGALPDFASWRRTPGRLLRGVLRPLLPPVADDARRLRYAYLPERRRFELLGRLGGNCAGALGLAPAGCPPAAADEGEADGPPLDRARLDAILGGVEPAADGAAVLPACMGGFMPKIAVRLRADGALAASAAGTHLLKTGETEAWLCNELFCLTLARAAGIDAVDAELRRFDGRPALLVARYDRGRDAAGRARALHQEDFCQALSVRPGVIAERDGGPGIRAGLELLGAVCAEPERAQVQFLERVAFSYLVGHYDLHGKNFSLLYRGRRPELAPAYDIKSAFAAARPRTRNALLLGRRRRLSEGLDRQLLLRHWRRVFPDPGEARTRMERSLETLARRCLERTPRVRRDLEAALGGTRAEWEPVCAGVLAAARRVLEAGGRDG